MHFNFPFSVLTVLWTLTFAAHLVLLVVLLGRGRVRPFPWFTATITVGAFRLLTSRLLFGRLPQMTMATIFIVVADIGAFLGLMVGLGGGGAGFRAPGEALQLGDWRADSNGDRRRGVAVLGRVAGLEDAHVRSAAAVCPVAGAKGHAADGCGEHPGGAADRTGGTERRRGGQEQGAAGGHV